MWRLLVLLAGCGFSATTSDPNGPIDGATTDASVDSEVSSGVGYSRSIDITDGLVSGTQANFPLLVTLTGDWLKSAPNGGHVANTDGSDIRFSMDAAGTVPLLRDVESYSPVTGTLVAWVRIPSLTAATVLYIQYGDPARVASGDPRALWTSAGYGGVWHLQPPATDASGQNATYMDMSSSTVAGQIAGARTFDGVDDVIDVGSNTAIDDIYNANGGTFEAWINATTTGENGAGRIVEKGAWLVCFASGALRFFSDWTSSDGDWQTPAAITLGVWHHVAIVYDGNNTATIYLDGTASTMQTSNPNGTAVGDASTTLQIGNRPGGDRTFEGIIDEVRLSKSMRAASWITTSYANQHDPMAFYTLGPETAL